MFSLENFYYVLYTNLLYPANIKESFFYPFGTNDAESIHVQLYSKFVYHRISHFKKHVIFYDQEPINPCVLPEFCRTKIVKTVNKERIPLSLHDRCTILASSERSIVKDTLLAECHFIDWYYFFHGFAALDWYRDYQYVPNIENQFSQVFISFNRLVTKDRSYRLYMVAKMMEKKLLDKGRVSLILKDNGLGTWQEELTDPNSRLSPGAKSTVTQYISKLENSLTIDSDNPPGHASANASCADLHLLKSALWHVVGETVFYDEKLHLTEKIFKPIVARRPFILVGASGNLAYLKSYGFKTFDRWIDESYDLEPDPDKRIDMVIDQLDKLCSLSHDELVSMHQEMEDILDYNFNHFYRDFKTIIVKELLDNFQGAISSWNSNGGLTYDRPVDISTINFEKIQKRLLQ